MYYDNREYRYRLEHCVGDKRKLVCPNCGQRTFVPYIDVETGEMIHEIVGRCDRENNCAYHLTPKQFFATNGCGPLKRYWFPQKNLVPPRDANGFSAICMKMVEDSISTTGFNAFGVWLREKFGFQNALQQIQRYRIGTSDYWKGATIFWQIDQALRVRTGKIMLYNYQTGHRVKNPTSKIAWVHVQPEFHDFKLRQCFFGENLLSGNSLPVCIVESEKTAVIASIFFKDAVFLATGGLNNLSASKCEVLKGREVILFPDLGAEEKWRTRAAEIPALARARISTWLQRHSSPADYEMGLDIGDFLEKLSPGVNLELCAFI